MLDPSAHHLGDDISKDPVLDPPLSEGDALERAVTLDRVPEGATASLVLDVVQVAGEANSPEFAKELRQAASSGPMSGSTAGRSTT